MPIANRIFRRLQACLHAPDLLRRSVARAMMAIGIVGFGLLPVAQAMQLHAAAGLQARGAAADELAAARQEVLAAQSETKRTRLALDDFLASHLDAQREVSSEPAPTLLVPTATDKAEPEKLSGELRELQAKRVVLLQTLTEEHPEVIEVSARIETLEARLNTAGMNNLPEAEDVAGKAGGNATAPALDAAEYQRLLGDWRTAERRLESARLAETAAADRLTAVTDLLLSSPAAQSPTARETSAPSLRHQVPPAELESREAHDSASAAALVEEDHYEKASRTQTLALASLALAVMLAALAAVRLARATADPLFASADEVSAALAVPVMGIVPYGVKASTAAGISRNRGLVLLGQITLALALFSAVAYAVVHFDVVVQFVRNPVETLRSWFSL